MTFLAVILAAALMLCAFGWTMDARRFRRWVRSVVEEAE